MTSESYLHHVPSNFYSLLRLVIKLGGHCASKMPSQHMFRLAVANIIIRLRPNQSSALSQTYFMTTIFLMLALLPDSSL